MIELEGLGRCFGRSWAVRGLACRVEPGRIFGLLGPNGAGKTTTIRMMTGLLVPTEGRVLIGGRDVARSPIEAKSVLGYVPDKSFLYERLTGREFLHFIASLHDVPRDEALSRIEALSSTLGVSDMLDETIGRFSHGMRQRLLFAAALAHSPRALVIDEPFVGLDPYGVRTIAALLTGLAREGTAIFLATHSLHIAQDVCHSVGIMSRGVLAATLGREDFALPGGQGLEDLFVRHTS